MCKDYLKDALLYAIVGYFALSGLSVDLSMLGLSFVILKVIVILSCMVVLVLSFIGMFMTVTASCMSEREKGLRLVIIAVVNLIMLCLFSIAAPLFGML